MGSWRHFIVESSHPEDALEKVRDVFDLPDYISARFVDDNYFYMYVVQGFPNDIHGFKLDEKWCQCSDLVDRFVEVSGNDTSDHTMADLYKVSEDGVEEIDGAASPYFPKVGGFSETEEIKKMSKTKIAEFYRGESYLRSYFMDKHDFKIWAGRGEENNEYEDIYYPENHLDMRHVCPVCKSSNIIVEGWDGKCKTCSYENKKPWFEGYRRFKGLARRKHVNRKPIYDSKLKNTLARIRLNYLERTEGLRKKIRIYRIRMNDFRRNHF